MIHCDPCQLLAAENKLLKQFIASLMEILGTNKVVLTVDQADVHYRPTASEAWEVTSD